MPLWGGSQMTYSWWKSMTCQFLATLDLHQHLYLKWGRCPQWLLRQLGGSITCLPQRGEEYLTDVPTSSMTCNRISNAYFSIRNDGRFYAMIPTEDRVSYCQLFKYKWIHKLSKQAQKQNAVMKNNRCSIKRCIECNVNLCATCINEWHGFDWGRINDCINK